MNEWNNDPIEIPSFVNIDDNMKSIFRKNIENHLIMEQLETDIEKIAFINFISEYLKVSKIYFFRNQKEKDTMMNYHKSIFKSIVGPDNFSYNKFSIRPKEYPIINKYFLFKDSFQASYLTKGCTFNEMIFVNIDKKLIDLNMFPAFFTYNERIKYSFQT